MPHIGSYGNIWEWDVVEIKGIWWQNWNFSKPMAESWRCLISLLQWGMILTMWGPQDMFVGLDSPQEL